MKKLLSLFVAVFVIFSLIACGNNKSNGDDDRDGGENNGNTDEGGNNNSGDSTPSEGDIKMDDIVFSSVYSSGVAIVNVKEEKDKAYVIDKSGNIIFDFPLPDNFTTSGLRYEKFENGLFVFNGKCYDTKGNVTLPETLGATSFVGLKEGKYIIAEKITSTYDSAKKELGVLNTSFEWIVPMKEGYYEIYHSNRTDLNNFFWNEVVNSSDKTKKAIKEEYGENIYLSDGTVMTPEDAGVSGFLDIYDNKYILAKEENGALGVMGTDGEWILEATVDLWNIYSDSYNNSVDIKGDYLVVEYYDYNFGRGIVYYDLLAKTYTAVRDADIISSYCENAAITKIMFDEDGYISDVVKNSISEDDIQDIYLYGSENNKYILVKVHQWLTRVYQSSDENNESSGSENVYAVLDRNLNWIVTGIVGDAEIKGDYLKVSGDYKNGYYDLRTKEFSTNEPSDFTEGEGSAESSLGFDFSSITNFYKATDFVDGKAAVAIWNREAYEMYITVVNKNGEFQFAPVKTPINKLPNWDLPLYFDGNYVVISDDIGCGTGHINSSMTLYTYSASGEKVAEWKASDNLDTWNCSFEYKDGVVVFRLISGQYSDYYRQSRVKYYTHDFKPLFK